MRLAIFKGDKRIEDLAARLFQARASDAQASKQATAALIEANPQLANLDRVPNGTVVVVPDTPLAVNASEEIRPLSTAAADFARSVAEHVGAFTSGLADAVGSADTQADSALKLLQDPSLKAAADNDPALKQRLTAIEANTNATVEDVKETQTTLQQALAQMQEDLAKFFPPPVPPSPVPAPSRPPRSPTPQPRGGGAPSPRPTPRPRPTPIAPAPTSEPTRRAAKPTSKTAARRGRRKTKPK
jgi:hypothetical protein